MHDSKQIQDSDGGAVAEWSMAKQERAAQHSSQHTYFLTQLPRVRITAHDFLNILEIAELIDSSALLRMRVDNAKGVIVDQTHPELTSGKLNCEKMRVLND